MRRNQSSSKTGSSGCRNEEVGAGDAERFYVPPLSESFIVEVETQLNRDYPTEQDCFKALTDHVRACKHCGNDTLEENTGTRRYLKCSTCSRSTWLTADTLFRGARNFRVRLTLIYFIQNGILMSAKRFADRMEVALGTVLNIYKKLGHVLAEQIEEDPNASSATFLRLYCKRSVLTPRLGHPREEEELAHNSNVSHSDPNVEPVMNQDQSFEELPAEPEITKVRLQDSQSRTVFGSSPVQINEHALKNASVIDGAEYSQPALSAGSGVETPSDEDKTDFFSAQIKLIRTFLSEIPVHFDELCESSGILPGPVSAVLTMLELGDFVVRHPGDYYSLTTISSRNDYGATVECSEAVMASARAFAALISDRFHGISRRYIQLYLGLFYGAVNSLYSRSGLLLELCKHAKPINARCFNDYVSPVTLRVPVFAEPVSGGFDN